jgi:hypothetical protein
MSAPVLCTVGVVIMFYVESHWNHQNTWKPIVCCLFSGCGINAFRMASSNSSLVAKSCACAYITFLAGIFSWYADCTLIFECSRFIFLGGGMGVLPNRGCLLTLAYYAFPRWYEGETGENRRTRRKTCPSATLSTTNPTCMYPVANPGLRGERPATNDLSHDTAPSVPHTVSRQVAGSVWLKELVQEGQHIMLRTNSLSTVLGRELSQYSVWLQTGRPGFGPRHRHRIFPVASVSRPALKSTQPLVQWVATVLSLGVKRGRGVTLATHLRLVPRSRMSRSYTSSPPSPSTVCSGAAVVDSVLN